MLFITFNNDQNLAVCSPSLNAIFYQTPSQRIFILWKFIVLNVYFKGVLTVSLVLFYPFWASATHVFYIHISRKVLAFSVKCDILRFLD